MLTTPTGAYAPVAGAPEARDADDSGRTVACRVHTNWRIDLRMPEFVPTRVRLRRLTRARAHELAVGLLRRVADRVGLVVNHPCHVSRRCRRTARENRCNNDEKGYAHDDLLIGFDLEPVYFSAGPIEDCGRIAL